MNYSRNEEPRYIRLGDQNLDTVDDGAAPADYKIKKFIKHENYNRNKRTNDIALVKLEKSVRFTAFIRPACLAQQTATVVIAVSLI